MFTDTVSLGGQTKTVTFRCSLASGLLAEWTYSVGINEPDPKNAPSFSSEPTGIEIEVFGSLIEEATYVLPVATDLEGDTITLISGPCTFC